MEELLQFAARIKEKYPDYKDVDDLELVERVVRKHPVYASQVKLPDNFRLLHTTSGYKNIDDLYEQIGREENVDPNLLLEQGRKETSFDPDVFYGRKNSYKGAKGAGQFMPGTAPLYGLNVSPENDERENPIKSIRAQAKYMRKLLDDFNNDESLALAGYNAGEYRKSLKNGQIPEIFETKDYVKGITENLAKSRQTGGIGNLKKLLGGQSPTPTSPTPTSPTGPTVPGVQTIQTPQTVEDNSARANLEKEREVIKGWINTSKDTRRIADGKKRLADIERDLAKMPAAKGEGTQNPTLPPTSSSSSSSSAPQIKIPEKFTRRAESEMQYQFEQTGKAGDGNDYLGFADGKHWFKNADGDTLYSELEGNSIRLKPVGPTKRITLDNPEKTELTRADVQDKDAPVKGNLYKDKKGGNYRVNPVDNSITRKAPDWAKGTTAPKTKIDAGMMPEYERARVQFGAKDSEEFRKKFLEGFSEDDAQFSQKVFTSTPEEQKQQKKGLLRTGTGTVAAGVGGGGRISTAANNTTNAIQAGEVEQPKILEKDLQANVDVVDEFQPFSVGVNLADAPEGVTKLDWAKRQLVQRIAEKTGLPYQDVEEVVKNESLTGTVSGQKASDAAFGDRAGMEVDVKTDLLYKIAERSKNREREKNTAIAQTIALGGDDSISDADRKELEQKYGITQKDLDYAKLSYGNPIFDVAREMREQAKNAQSVYEGQGDSPFIARTKALRDVGILSPEQAQEIIAKESPAEKSLRENLAYRKSERPDGSVAPQPSSIRFANPEQIDAELARMIKQNNGSFAQTLQTLEREKQEEIDREQRVWEQQLTTRPLYMPLEFAKNFYRAVPKAVSSILKSISIADSINPLSMLYDLAKGEQTPAEKKFFYRVGQGIDDFVEKHIPQDKDLRHKFLTSTLPDTIAQFVIQLGAGAITGGATAPVLIGASMGASSQYEEADKYKASENVKLLSALVGGLAAVPDAIPFAKWLKPLNAVEKTGFISRFLNALFGHAAQQIGEEEAISLTRQVAKNVIVGGLMEGTQEVSENKINDALAAMTYDPERGVLLINNNDIESFVAGFVGGSFGGTVETVAELKGEEKPLTIAPEKFAKTFDTFDTSVSSPNEQVEENNSESQIKPFKVGDKVRVKNIDGERVVKKIEGEKIIVADADGNHVQQVKKKQVSPVAESKKTNPFDFDVSHIPDPETARTQSNKEKPALPAIEENQAKITLPSQKNGEQIPAENEIQAPETDLPTHEKPPASETIQPFYAQNVNRMVVEPPKRISDGTSEKVDISSTSAQNDGDIVGFKTAKGSIYTIDGQSTQREKSYHPEHGKDDVGVKKPSAVTYYTDEQGSQLLGLGGLEMPKGADAVIRVADNGDGTFTGEHLYYNPVRKEWQNHTKNYPKITLKTNPEVGLHPVELWKPEKISDTVTGYRNSHAGNKIVEIQRKTNKTSSDNALAPDAIKQQSNKISQQLPADGEHQSAETTLPSNENEANISKSVAAGIHPVEDDETLPSFDQAQVREYARSQGWSDEDIDPEFGQRDYVNRTLLEGVKYLDALDQLPKLSNLKKDEKERKLLERIIKETPDQIEFNLNNAEAAFGQGTREFIEQRLKPYFDSLTNKTGENSPVSEKEKAKLEKAQRAASRKPRSAPKANSRTQSLSTWLNRSGGFRPSQVIDLSAIKKAKMGKLLIRTGSQHSIEDAFRRAVEAGYFAGQATEYNVGAFEQNAGSFDMSIDDFVEAVAADLNGNRHYSSENEYEQEIEQEFADGVDDEVFDEAVRIGLFTKKPEVAEILKKLEKSGEISEDERQTYYDIAKYESDIPREVAEEFWSAAVETSRASAQSSGTETFAPVAEGTANSAEGGESIFAEEAEEIDESEPEDGEVDLSFDFSDEENPADKELDSTGSAPSPTANKFPTDLFGKEIQPKHQDSLFGASPEITDSQIKFDQANIEATRRVFGKKTADFLGEMLHSKDKSVEKVAAEIASRGKFVEAKGEAARAVVEDTSDALEIFHLAKQQNTTVAEILNQPRLDGVEFSAQAQDFARAMEQGNFASVFGKALSEAKTTAESKLAKSVTAPITDFGEKIGGARKDNAESGFTVSQNKSTSESSASSSPSSSSSSAAEMEVKTPAWMKGYEIGATPEGTFRPLLADDKGRFRRILWQSKEEYSTEAEALRAIKAFAVMRKFNLRETQDGKFELYRRVTDRKFHTIKEFESKEAAIEYIAKNTDELLNYKPQFPERPHIEDLRRTGKDFRSGGQNVTTTQFLNAFGFTGGEFGNWIPQDERQRLLNMAFDGLMDLAEILRIPPRAISLNGQLSIAFGARGHGLTGAAAHYERQRAVFNLTRLNGAGSMAHEWFHALDHYFGAQDRGETLAKNEKGIVESVRGRDSDFLSHGSSYRSKARKETVAAFADLIKTIYKQPKIVEVSVDRYSGLVERYEKELTGAIRRLREHISSDKRYTRKRTPASPEQLEKFGSLVERIETGKLGAEAEISTKSSWHPIIKTSEVFKELNDLVTAITGRSEYKYDRERGTNGQVRDLERTLTQLIDSREQLKKYQADNKEERQTPTRYSYNARDIDKMRSSDYWSTEHEMAARAFEAYIEDRLKEKGDVSQYLVHSTENSIYKLLFDLHPYPEGVERARINDAFDKFFEVVEADASSSADGNVMLKSAASAQVETGNLGFYQSAEKAILDTNQEKFGDKNQLRKELLKNGAKESELAAIGVEDFLNSKESFTKKEVLDFIRANQIEINEVVKNSSVPSTDGYIEQLPNGKYLVKFSGLQGESFWNKAEAEQELGDKRRRFSVNETKFPSSQLGGAKTNYRERFITAPNFSEKWNDGHKEFSDVENPVVRLRTADRTDATGANVLIVEEFQTPKKDEFAMMPPILQKNAYQIGVKYALRLAAEGDYEKIVWTTGEQQIERGNLENHFERIEYRRAGFDGDKFAVKLFSKDGTKTHDDVWSEKQLESSVGKDVAKKITETAQNQVRILAGAELKPGGAGLKILYDQAIPNLFNKIVKKFGGKVGVSEIETGDGGKNEVVHAVTITPQIRKSVIANGLPLFKVRDQQANDLLSVILPKAHPSDVLAGISSKFTGENLELSEFAAEQMRRLLAEDHYRTKGTEPDEKAFDALTLGAGNIEDIVRLGREMRVDFLRAGYAAAELAGYDELLNNLEKLSNLNGDDYSIVYVFDDALPEEEFHRDDLRAGRTDREALHLLKQSPIWKNPGNKFSNDYPQLSEADKASEIAAKLATGQAEKYGWDKIPDFEAEKENFLKVWAQGIVRRNFNKIQSIGIEAFKKQFERIIQYADFTENEQGRSRSAQPENSGSKSARRDNRAGSPKDGRSQPESESESDNGNESDSTVLRETGAENDDRAAETKRESAGTSTSGTSASRQEIIDEAETLGASPESVKFKNRKYAATLRENGRDSLDVPYIPESEIEWIEEAKSILEESRRRADENENGMSDYDHAIDVFESPETKPSTKTALGIALIDHLGAAGEYTQMLRVAEATVNTVGTAAQALRASQLVSKYDFEKGVMLAQKAVEARGKSLTETEIQKIRELTEKYAESERERGLLDYALQTAQEQINALQAEYDDINEALGEAKEEISDKVQTIGNLKRQLARWKNKVLGTSQASVRIAKTHKELSDKRAAIVAKLKEKFPDKLALLKQVAWHGSPHRFDRFDISKIGTGEGAQAYGYGLYFTNQESVANHYRNTLSLPRLKFNGKLIEDAELTPEETDFAHRLESMFQNEGNLETALDRVIGDVQRYTRFTRGIDATSDSELTPYFEEIEKEAKTPELAQEAIALAVKMVEGDESIRTGDTSTANWNRLLEIAPNAYHNVIHDVAPMIEEEREIERIIDFYDNHKDNIKIDNGGAKYRVDLKPEPDEYLLWDKPLSEQSEKVKEAVEKRNIKVGYSKDPFGDEIYQWITRPKQQRELGIFKDWETDTQQTASFFLKSLGIRGIKYLDGSSRGKGEGSYNYVIFDDNDVEIKEILKSVFSQPESATSETFDDETRQALVEYAALQIFDSVPYQELIQNISDITRDVLNEAEIKAIHADAFEMTRGGSHESAKKSDDVSNRIKVRAEHRKQASDFRNPPLPREKRKLYKNPNLNRLEREILELAGGDETLGAAGVLMNQARSKNDWFDFIDRLLPDASEKELNALYRRSFELKTEARDALKKQKLEVLADADLTMKEFREIERRLKIALSEARKHRQTIDGYYRELGKSLGAKIIDAGMEAVNILKGTGATGEISYLLRQGALPLILDTRAAVRGDWEGVGHGLFNNPEQLAVFIEKVRSHARFKEAQAAGAKFSQIGDFNIADEHFSSKLLEKIPLYRRAEAAYTLPGDLQRLYLFDAWAKVIEDQTGLSEKEIASAKRYAAEVINALTGKGDVKKVLASGGGISKLLNTIFFSPSLLVSRFQSAYYLSTGFATAPKGMRRQMAKKGLRFYSAVGLLAYLLGMALDPDDDDFGKIEVKKDSWLHKALGDEALDMHFDLLAGMDKPLQLMFRTAAGIYKAVANNDKDYFTDAMVENSRQLFVNKSGEWKFLRGKLSPGASWAVDAYMGTDYIGRPYTNWGALSSRLLPMSWGQVYDALVYDRADAMMKEPVTMERAQKRWNDNERKYANAAVILTATFLGAGITEYPKGESSRAVQKAQELSDVVSEKSPEQRRVEGGLRSLIKEKLDRQAAGENTTEIDGQIRTYAAKYQDVSKDVKSLNGKYEKNPLPPNVRTKFENQAANKNGLLEYYAADLSAEELRRVLPLAESPDEIKVLENLLKEKIKKK